jgi:DUF971 family protein
MKQRLQARDTAGNGEKTPFGSEFSFPDASAIMPRTDRHMAGPDRGAPSPTEITLHRQSRVLEIAFSNGRSFRLPCEFLRVYSPSAEVRGHGPGQEVLQTGKRAVEITRVEPVGQYAVQLHFSDGHATGIYSWDLLYEYGERHDEMWRRYLKRMEEAGASRDPKEVSSKR